MSLRRMGSGCKDPHIIALNYLEVSDPTYPGERAPSTHWIQGCVRYRIGLGDIKKRKRGPSIDSNSDVSVVKPVAPDCVIPAYEL
jgi:hypothetical protein